MKMKRILNLIAETGAAPFKKGINGWFVWVGQEDYN